jgi:glyceraldehyde-3-phosphate dehydrogenase/erythrose-4-phosphate dehydrogenase
LSSLESADENFKRYSFNFYLHTKYKDICNTIKNACNTDAIKNILSYTNDEVVSSDFIANPYSSICDAKP